MNKIIKESQRLRIRVAEFDELAYIVDLETRPENVLYIMPDDMKKQEEYFADDDCLQLIVEEKATGERVGYLLVVGLTNPNKEIEWRRIIADKKEQGYGHEMLAMLEAWSFDDLKMHRGWLDAKEHNARALAVYEKAGLKREALLRETILYKGEYQNLVILAILDREYYALKEKGEIPICE